MNSDPVTLLLKNCIINCVLRENQKVIIVLASSLAVAITECLILCLIGRELQQELSRIKGSVEMLQKMLSNMVPDPACKLQVRLNRNYGKSL